VERLEATLSRDDRAAYLHAKSNDEGGSTTRANLSARPNLAAQTFLQPLELNGTNGVKCWVITQPRVRTGSLRWMLRCAAVRRCVGHGPPHQ
jgi:hypothetical protein